jgi:hypothetical protein
MGDENVMAKRGKALEEEYFQRKEKELLEKLRKRRAEEEARKELSEAAGTPDEDILKTLQELGYTRETVALLHLVPLIHVAWVDGRVSQGERDMIFEAAGLRGVTEGTPAYEQLVDWLDHRPSEEFFEHNLRITKDLLETSERTDDGHGMLDQAMRVASASGGLLGFGSKISSEEKALLERIARAIGKKHDDA